MRVRERVGRALALAAVLVGGPIGAGHPLGTRSVASTLVLRSFFEAYDRHDVAAALGNLNLRHPRRLGRLSGCDYAFFRDATAGRAGEPSKTRLPAIKRWLQARFAEDDRYDEVSIPSDAVGPQHILATAVRTSQVLAVAGLPPQKLTLSAGVDRASGRIYYLVEVPSALCAWSHGLPGPEAPPSPGQTRTRALMAAFVAAYDGRLLGRAMQLFDSTPNYVDCSLSNRSTEDFMGRKAVGARLTKRFSHYDHLAIQAFHFGDPQHPGIAGVDALRSGPSTGTLRAGFKVVTNRRGFRLHAIVSEMCGP